MKKLILSAAVFMFLLLVGTNNASAAEQISIDEAHFPEMCIREEVRNIHDKNHDGILSVEEQEAVTDFWVYKFCDKDDYPTEYLNAPCPEYTMDDLTLDFKGMEYFTNLKNIHLDCSYAHVYVKGLKQRDKYDIKVKNFESLSKCLRLETILWFRINESFLLDDGRAVDVDVSKWSQLKNLSLYISNKNVTFTLGNKKLKTLHAGGNNIKLKNISGCPKLRELSLECKNIKSLNLSKCRNLRQLSVAGVRGIKTICVYNDKLTYVPAKKNASVNMKKVWHKNKLSIYAQKGTKIL